MPHDSASSKHKQISPIEKNRKVLVTGGLFDPATNVVRSLYKSGVKVHVADSYKLSPALHSHIHSTQRHEVPSPAKEPIQFAEAFARIVNEFDLDLVIPTFEEGFYLARHTELIPATLFAPAFETIAQLHRKSSYGTL